MISRIRCLGIASLFVLGSVGFAQYTMELTGVGDGVTADGAYVSPYQGTITENGNSIYSGYMICDDFNTESFLDSPWSATMTNVGNLNGTEKFGFGSAQQIQQNYSAAAWLANGLLANLNNAVAQINYSFAIWDIFNSSTPSDPDGGAGALITQARAAVQSGYVGGNVTVYTPSPRASSQEFLVVTPEPPAPAILAFDLLSVLAIFYLLRRYRVRV